MCSGSVQKISWLEFKVSSSCLHYLAADQGGPPTWRLHTKLYNFGWNISTNILTFGQCTHLKSGELSLLFISYNITVFWLYPLHGFLFYVVLFDSAHTIPQPTKPLTMQASNFRPMFLYHLLVIPIQSLSLG